MAKKRRLTKKEMKQDQLVTVTLRVSNFIQDHFTHVISGIVVLVAILAVVLFTAQARRSSAKAAGREFYAAMSQYQAGRKDEAGTAFATVADRYSGHRDGKMALYFLAECRMAQGKYDEAIEAYDRYLGKVGREGDFSHAAQIAKAYSYEALGRFKEAAQTLKDLSESMDPEDGRYHEVLFDTGSFYYRAGDASAALEFFRRVRENADGALRDRAEVWVALLE
jgi:tetratricopeptide (TPR) repeat protein